MRRYIKYGMLASICLVVSRLSAYDVIVKNKSSYPVDVCCVTDKGKEQAYPLKPHQQKIFDRNHVENILIEGCYSKALNLDDHDVYRMTFDITANTQRGSFNINRHVKHVPRTDKKALDYNDSGITDTWQGEAPEFTEQGSWQEYDEGYEVVGYE
jgi:hypothetical protein